MYSIQGTYHGKTEELDTADTEQDAQYLTNEYQIAYGNQWTVFYVFGGDSRGYLTLSN